MHQFIYSNSWQMASTNIGLQIEMQVAKNIAIACHTYLIATALQHRICLKQGHLPRWKEVVCLWVRILQMISGQVTRNEILAIFGL